MFECEVDPKQNLLSYVSITKFLHQLTEASMHKHVIKDIFSGLEKINVEV